MQQIDDLLIPAGLDWTMSFNGKPEVRDGKTYMKMLKFKLVENHIDSCKFRFGNLGELGDILNQFLEENWRDLYVEIDNNIFSNFRAIWLERIQRVFSAIPYAELFDDGQDQVV